MQIRRKSIIKYLHNRSQTLNTCRTSADFCVSFANAHDNLFGTEINDGNKALQRNEFFLAKRTWIINWISGNSLMKLTKMGVVINFAKKF